MKLARTTFLIAPTVACAHALAFSGAAPFERLEKDIGEGKLGRIQSVLVYQNGKSLYEGYFNGSSASDVHVMQSVTKSITGLLVGIAIKERSIKSVQDRVSTYLPTYKEAFNDSRKARWTIADIINMRTGMSWNEHPYEGSRMQRINNHNGDWAEFFLGLTVEEDPGTSFEYNSGAAILMSRVLWNATGVRPDLYTEEKLFKPLGIGPYSWYRSRFNQLPHTGGGLDMRARDLLKIGVLVLNEGAHNGRQIVPRDWIRSLSSSSPVVSFGSLRPRYNRFWWLFPSSFDKNAKPSIITASGFGGQWLFVMPDKKAVVAMTGDSGQSDQSLRVLYEYLIPILDKRKV